MAVIAVILVLPIEYNTSSMLRCKSIIFSLAQLGHDVKIYCPYPNTSNRYYSGTVSIQKSVEIYRFGRKHEIYHSQLGDEVAAISIKRKSIEIAKTVFRRVDVFGSTLLYLPERKKISNDIRNNGCDCIISFSDPMPAHMLAKYCIKHNPKVKYIQQWGDPLASDTISKTSQPVWLRKIIEKSLIKPADRICYVSPFTCDEQKKLFPRLSSKMIFLPTPSLEYDDFTLKHDKLCVGYFGSYNSAARNIIPFYEAAKLNFDIDFLIIGDSDLKLEPADNIVVLNRLSKEALDAYMKKVDVIVCLMNIKGNQIPGKVYHDASSTKDILFIKDGEYGEPIQRFFSKYDHYTFSDNSIDAINKVLRFYKECGVPKRIPVEEFKAITIANKLIEGVIG